MQIHVYMKVSISITNPHPGEWCQRGGDGPSACQEWMSAWVGGVGVGVNMGG